MEHAKPNNLPVLLGVGAIALAALAAGLAAGPYLRGEPAGPVVPDAATGPVEPAAGGGAEGEGLTLPPGPEGAGTPGGAGGEAAAGAEEAARSEEERLGDLLSDIITQFGELRRRVEALEKAKGGGGAGGDGMTRLDPKTGQEYRAVTVWVPEGMEEEAAVVLRDLVLDRLAREGGVDLHKRFSATLRRVVEAQPEFKDTSQLSVRVHWYPVAREFAAAWSGRDTAVLDEFLQLLSVHALRYQVAVDAENLRLRASDPSAAPHLAAPDQEPSAESDLRPAWNRLKKELRRDWRAFVDELPFDVKARYLSWCSSFLKGD